MTRKQIHFYLTLLLLSLSLAAYPATDYRLGYCSGKVDTSEGAFSVEGNVTVEAAIYLPAETLARFRGDAFSGVNAGLASKLNVHEMTVWVREGLEQANLAETTIDIRSAQKPRDGWNNIAFETPVDIRENTGYYVGYTFTQTKTSSAVSAVDGEEPDACWIKTGEEGWRQRPETGILCIEALISGDNLPTDDLRLISASLSRAYCVAGEPARVIYEIRNEGINTVDSYVLEITASGTDFHAEKQVSQTLNYGVSRNYTEEISLDGLEPGREYDLEISVATPNGNADTMPDDNSVVIKSVPVISAVFPRTVLLEEFTTERCSNCPAAAQTIQDMISMMTDEQKARFVMVCHHSGYYEDPFTLECDREYEWFYNDNGSTYAPAFMLDREEESGSRIKTPVFMNLPANDFLYKVSSAQDVPALYSIGLDGIHDPELRTVKLEIKGETVLRMFSDPRITVYLTENNVGASERGQAGAGTGYIHNHVERAYNATWGESPEWDGDSYSYSCTLTYPEGCSPEEMHVVAFISNYDPQSPVACGIGNVASSSLTDLKPSAVADMNDDMPLTIELRDMQGTLINKTGETSGLQHGVYLIIKRGQEKTTVSKVMVK